MSTLMRTTLVEARLFLREPTAAIHRRSRRGRRV
jgi:hypothetical protein